MATERMDIDSAVACEGGKGEYLVWAHHLSGSGVVKAVLLGLPPARRVEENVDFSNFEPTAVLGLLESERRSARLLLSLGELSTMTLIRRCKNRSHADGEITRVRGGRLEAAARALLTPDDAETTAVYGSTLQQEGDALYVTGRKGVKQFGPIVSVPLTEMEQRQFEERSVHRVVPVVPTPPKGPLVYGLVHATGTDKYLEEIKPARFWQDFA